MIWKKTALMLLLPLFAGCLSLETKTQDRPSPTPKIIQVTATSNSLERNNNNTEEISKIFLDPIKLVKFSELDFENSVQCLQIIQEKYSTSQFEGASTLLLRLVHNDNATRKLCLSRLLLLKESQAVPVFFLVDIKEKSANQLVRGENSSIIKLALQDQEKEHDVLTIKFNKIENFPDLQTYSHNEVEDYISSVEYTTHAGVLHREFLEDKATNIVGGTILLSDYLESLIGFTDVRIKYNNPEIKEGPKSIPVEKFEGIDQKTNLINFITGVNTIKFIDNASNNPWNIIPDIPDYRNDYDYKLGDDQQITGVPIFASDVGDIWKWDKTRLLWYRYKENSFNQKDFLNDLGDPETYKITINGIELIPGMSKSGLTVHDKFGSYSDLYGVIASYPYEKKWTSSEGYSYNIWLFDLAFPRDGAEPYTWSTLPIIIWVDCSDGDPRMLNGITYSINKVRASGTYNFWDHKMHLSVDQALSGGYSEVEDAPSQPIEKQPIETGKYFEARNKTLAQFKPGKGIYFIHLAYLLDPEVFSDLSRELPEKEKWGESGPNISERLFYFLEQIARSWDIPTPNCLEKVDEGQFKLINNQCAKSSTKEFAGGSSITSSAIFFDVNW